MSLNGGAVNHNGGADNRNGGTVRREITTGRERKRENNK